MPEDTVQLKFGGDNSDLTASMQQVQASVSSALEKMTQALQSMTDQSKKTSQEITNSNKQIQDAFGNMQAMAEKSFNGVTGALSTLRNSFVAIGAVLAGGAMFKASVDAAKQWDGEVSKLARTMGITTERASELNVALRLIGADTDTYTSALAMLVRQLRMQEETLNNLGMVTRDSNGQLVNGEQAMNNALAMVRQYKQGLDQTVVSQIAFGRGSEGMATLLRLNNEIMDRAKTLADELGLKIGKDNVSAMRAYQVELNAFKLLWTSVEVKIGNEVMKVLTQLANYLNTDGRAAVNNFADMVKYLIGTLDLAVSTARAFIAVWEAVKKMPGAVADDMKQVGSAMMMGPMAEQNLGEETPPSYEFHKRATASLQEDLMKTLDNLDKGFQARWEALWKNLPTPKITETGSGGKSAPDDVFKEGKGKGKDGGKSTIVSEWEEELARLKDSQDDLNAWSSSKDYEFWNQKLAIAQRGSQEWWQIWHKMAELFRELTTQQQAELLKQAQQEQKVADERSKFEIQHEQNMYDMQKEALHAQMEMGQITQKEMLRLEKEMLDQRYQAQLADLQRRLELAKNDPDKDPVALEKIYIKMRQVTEKYWQDQKKIENQAARDSKKTADEISSTLSSATKSMLFSTQTMAQRVQGVFETVTSKVIDGLIKKTVDSWLLGETRKTAATVAGEESRVAVKTAAQGQGMLASVGMMLKEVMSSAYLAGAKAYAAVVGIPYVGPFLAPIAAAVAFAAVAAFGGGISYEVGAWDIPGEQMARLHPGEMVLPAEPAEAFRKGAGGGGGGDTYIIQALDTRSFHQALRSNRSSLIKVIKEAQRDNVR